MMEVGLAHQIRKAERFEVVFEHSIQEIIAGFHIAPPPVRSILKSRRRDVPFVRRHHRCLAARPFGLRK
jgi:hypothetical protein